MAILTAPANPVDKATQLKQLNDAVRLIESWNYDIEIVKRWVDEHWTAYEV